MPKATQRGITPAGWVLLPLLVAAYVYGLWSKPLWVGGATAVLIVYALVEQARTKRQLSDLAALRGDESLCTFARHFKRQRVDTWVVRAVYEELQQHLRGEYALFPLRPSDRLSEDLKIDPEDLDVELAQDIAARTGRSLRDTRANPYYGRVQTVEDLVAFFCAQPKQAGEQPDAADGA